MPPSPVEDATDASTTTCTFTGDELDLPSSLFSEDPAAIGCSRPIWDGTDSDRCVWHAEGTDKPPDDLAATVADSTLLGARARETDLHRVPFPEEPDLRKADLSEADLYDANLSEANLYDADLSEADLRKADLSEAVLTLADLSGAELIDANLSEATLNQGNLSEAAVSDADLSKAKLNGADLSEASLVLSNLSEVEAFPHSIKTIQEDIGEYEYPDLSEAQLFEADLSEAEFQDADLSGAGLADADLSEAEFQDADLSETELSGANLSKAKFSETNLSRARLYSANLSGADLRTANLSEANLAEITLTDVAFSRDTEVDNPRERIEQGFQDEDISEQHIEDTIARVNGELRATYSTNGLFGRARTARIRERRARRKESKAEEGYLGTVAWAGSFLSRVFTGYGIQLWPVVVWMILLFVGSTAVYLHAGVRDTTSETIAYSVLAFTVAPPPPLPLGTLVQTVVMIETFFGTLSTVLLGYILGNREMI